ncbi:MAG: hypothetical protein JWO91_1819 [Acidobacteriaceae bacterium]|nr:hypothetical protein [Acidobacteriaceae bacterium]
MALCGVAADDVVGTQKGNCRHRDGVSAWGPFGEIVPTAFTDIYKKAYALRTAAVWKRRCSSSGSGEMKCHFEKNGSQFNAQL